MNKQQAQESMEIIGTLRHRAHVYNIFSSTENIFEYTGMIDTILEKAKEFNQKKCSEIEILKNKLDDATGDYEFDQGMGDNTAIDRLEEFISRNSSTIQEEINELIEAIMFAADKKYNIEQAPTGEARATWMANNGIY